MNKFIAVFEDKKGKPRRKFIDADNLEDATIEASNIGDQWDWELLSVDYKENVENTLNKD